jgi:Zn-dependent protease
MKWSWKIGKVVGIDVYIHATFTLLLGWVGITHWLSGRTLEAATGGIVVILALFTCVLLHEFGHALAAWRYGIATRDITLLPIGGVARLERMPEKPAQELWVALAGPLVNVVIAAGWYVWLTLTHHWTPVSQSSVATGPFRERLLMANISSKRQARVVSAIACPLNSTRIRCLQG